jgi:hypothetical protein
MSRRRLLIAVAAGCGLLLLLAWQVHREARIEACIEKGGRWDGPTSRCVPDPSRITIQRDLYRS